MSQEDLEFIDRALAHPWMFWVYFWKWPRIVRQACAEYDMLAKERDVAKAAHEEAVVANKKLLNWVYVTHRLSDTVDLRAIFTAMKRFIVLLTFLIATDAFGQLPPILRNQWTTNADPRAVKVISTNGVQAATNIWELDFTNTASVTVSAVANANKVMVSFTGSTNTGSGSSSMTNALLWAGPTNGSVSPLILTAGNGVTLTTDGTNRVAAIDTNLVAEISDLLWTNVASGSTVLGKILTPTLQYGNFQLATNRLGFWGDYSLVMAVGAPAIDLAYIGTNVPNAYFFGDYSGYGAVFTNDCYVFVGIGEQVFQNMIAKDSSQVIAIGEVAMGAGVTLTSSHNITSIGNHSLYSVDLTNSFYIVGIGHKALEDGSVTDSSFMQMEGISSGQNSIFHTCANIFCSGAFGLSGSTLTNCGDIFVIGSDFVAASVLLTNCFDINIFGGRAGTNLVLTAKTNIYIFGNILSSIPDSREFWFGNTNNVYRMPGNIGTIRGVTGYSWPTAHALGALTNNGSGGLGYFNGYLTAQTNDGVGIASVYTNNVLAGGPGLTELGFTNTATVTVAATTNAGRVTLSFDASASSSGIATNNGTGWNTTLYSPTNSAISTDKVSLTIQGVANQTGDLQQWLKSDGTTNALLRTNGQFLLPINASAPTIAVLSSPGNGIAFSSAGTFDFYQSGALRTRFGNGAVTGTDNFGIGATAGNPDVSWYRLGAASAAFGTGANSGFSRLTVSNLQVVGSVSITNALAVGGGLNWSRFATNGNVSMTTNFYVWGWTANAVAGTLTLPSASTSQGIHFIIKDEGGNAAATNITIAVQSGDAIDSATTATLTANFAAKRLYSAGSTNWFTY